ncbi:MAG: 2-C-methyl-D-erythritol 2,4-cyclodiphosphate synthase [Dehalococcoidia bacterium]|nr:2-C-methyl-D-erythritol 2,4-cyclodiphosphate synthase [Dehalococcoidia bacterium]
MVRIGIGYDVHPLVVGRKLILGGVDVPFERGLEGHSDADALVHAIMDALLGAAALGDIGTHFPPADEQYRGISSLVLLSRVGGLLTEKEYRIVNIDATIVAQRPKLAAYINEMRLNISHVLGVTVDRVSVKATTSEGLGFIGRAEGIAALAIAMIEGGR